MKGKWYQGIPPVETVKAHESDHPRPDGLRLGTVAISPGGRLIKSDDRSFGDWLEYHPKGRIEPYSGVCCLKVIDGVIYKRIGFTQWEPLIGFLGVQDIQFFPVGQNGLPEDNL